MTSVRETAVQALANQLANGLSGVIVERNTATPETVPTGGLVIVRDGDPGEAVEVEVSPPSYSYEHPAPVEILVRANDPQTRATRLDQVLRDLHAAIDADRTLGGAVDYVETGAPGDPSDFAPPGDDTIKAAIVVLTLVYDTDDPLT